MQKALKYSKWRLHRVVFRFLLMLLWFQQWFLVELCLGLSVMMGIPDQIFSFWAARFFFEISLADIYPLPKTTKGLNFSPVQDKKQITFRFDPVIIKK